MEICRPKDCCGCGCCAESCPIKCITLKINEEGFYYPKVNSKKCVQCGKCQVVCPINNVVKLNNMPEAYALMNTQKRVRSESSSGGAFYSFSEKVFLEGGIVYGVAFSEDCTEVRHRCAENIEEIWRLMGAKYVQSTPTNNLYESIRRALKNGKTVLFSGTPCQVSACKNFLKNDNTEKLITIDLICHGVPSPGVWKKYLEEAMHGAKQVSFRNKVKGWRKFSMHIVDNDGNVFSEGENQNCYMKGFLNDLYSRLSCYDCKFKGLSRVSDITLGDFWGVQDIVAGYDDDMGTSIVFIHTEKGKQLLDSLKMNKDISICKVDARLAAKSNPMIYESVRLVNAKRKKFFSQWQSLLIEDNVNRCLYKSMLEKIIGKMKWIILKK